jgi:transcriptional regulator with GAF, ATPase, and Fis domain
MTLHIRTALKTSEGKIHGHGGAAELLGIKPNTLRARMDRLGITYGRKKG